MSDGTTRISRALAYAEQIHAGVLRKHTNIPYLAHVMGVAVMVLEAEGTEDEAIAGLLHDTIEDGHDPDSVRAHIHTEFGPRVLEIVEAMTDAAPGPGETKPPWRPRKEAYVNHLAECADRGIHRVCLADKLYNLRATNDDFDEIGAAVWDRFHAGPEEQRWYYEMLGQAFASGPLAGSRSERAYQAELGRLTASIASGPDEATERTGLRSTVTPEEWDRRATASGLEWIERPTRSGQKTRARCLRCGHEWSPRASSVAGGSGCPRCAQERTRVSRITDEEWDRRAAAAGLEWVERPRNSLTKTPARCLTCGHQWSPTGGNVTTGSGCPKCGRKRASTAVRSRVSDEEWDRRAEVVGLEWTTPYAGAAAKRGALCVQCGHEWQTRPLNVYKGSGCPVCARERGGQARRISDEEWDARAQAAGLEWIEPHTRADRPRKARCLACGYEYAPIPDHVRKGSGCPRCVVSVEEWDRRAADVGIEWIEPHQRADLPRKARCLSCGTEYAPPPRSVADGSGCGACATTGLDRTAPALVYLLTIDSPPLMKVGVANVGSRRLGDHRARGWTLVQTWGVPDGYDAERVEAATLTWWRTQGALFARRDEVPARDGYTETVWRGRVDVPDTQRHIEWLTTEQ